MAEFQVVGANGTVVTVPAAIASGLIRNGTVKLANPADAARLQAETPRIEPMVSQGQAYSRWF